MSSHAERHPVVNKELANLSETLNRRHVAGKLDGFCTYLLGVIHGHLAEQPVTITADELSQDSTFARKPNVCYHIFPLSATQSSEHGLTSRNFGDQAPAPISDALMSTKEAKIAKQRHILITSIKLYPWNWFVST
jgi:hypothetical protein